MADDKRKADYKVESIIDVKVADDPSSVRIAVAAGAEQVVLTIDWCMASDLIDRMTLANNEIRHSLHVPDWRARRVSTGCHRLGIGVAVLLLLPVLYGVGLWLLGDLDPQAWTMVLWFLLAAPLAYGVIWLIGWIVSGFVGKRERSVTPEQSAAGPAQPAAEPQPTAAQ
jgi:hypothetical protein